jgi:hypothetical protein
LSVCLAGHRREAVSPSSSRRRIAAVICEYTLSEAGVDDVDICWKRGQTVTEVRST